MWEKINIMNVEPYKSFPKVIKSDRVKVTLDMPIDTYSEFRVQIEAPQSLRGRRSGDKTQTVDTSILNKNI